MKRKNLAKICAGLVFIAGFFSLVCVINKRNMLEVPFSEFTMIYRGTTLLGISLMIMAMIISGFGLLVLTLRKDWSSSVLDRIKSSVSNPRLIIVLISILILFNLIMGQLFLQTGTTENALQRSFLVMNRPFFTWFILFSLLCIVVLVISNGSYRRVIQPDFIKPILLTLVLIIIIIILSESSYGFQRTSEIGGNFRLTGYPILDYQVFFAWIGIIGLFFLVCWIYLKWGKDKKIPPHYLDLIIGIVLFAVAFFIWRSTPVEANAFIDQPRPPNYEFTPNLDAVIYDRTAQNLLSSGRLQSYIGGGHYQHIARRPLLVVYLAVIHWLGGLLYEDILDLQIAFFALLPVVIYLLTKILHNRLSGILAAVLVIIRQLTGMKLGSEVWGGTNLHMLMSDVPATMGMVLFLILFVVWLKNPKERNYFSLIVGGVLGLMMLIRQELAAIVPFVALAAMLDMKGRFNLFIKNMFLLLAGTIIVITPWVVRNWVNSGQIYLDVPGNRLNAIRNTLILLIEDWDCFDDDTGVLDNQDQAIPNDHTAIPFESNSSGELIGNHLSNAILQSFLYLPSYPLALDMDFLSNFANGQIDKKYGGVFYSPYKYVKVLPYWWWQRWDGKIDQRSWISLSLVIALISLGFYRVWKNKRWIALVPVFALLAHVFVFALARRSGGRFLMEVDWITGMFLSIGLIELFLSGMVLWSGQIPMGKTSIAAELIKADSDLVISNKSILGVFLLILFLGTLPVLLEIVLPNQYPVSKLDDQLELLLNVNNPVLNSENQELLRDYMDNGGEVIYGRALYPRYFPPGAALMTTNETLFPSSTTFTIAGTELNFVVLPRLGSPAVFPHGADVLTFGCRETSFPPDPGFICLGCQSAGFDAAVVVVLNEVNGVEDVLWRDGFSDGFIGCPLSWP